MLDEDFLNDALSIMTGETLRTRPKTSARTRDVLTHEEYLEAAQERRSLKKCRRDLNEFIIALSVLKCENGTVTTSRSVMESITERFYTKLSRSTQGLPVPDIPAGYYLDAIKIVEYSQKKSQAPPITFNIVRGKNWILSH
ncbi:unnamed protein product [Nippostrongylus brasiliensis]|uniref:Uncharacterized protein n=1 Tax=Nippostrongylus brasiliensis TaxID=27835 RepID=A0A0N4Y9P5_NIPBR|nr:unnamed protein product [Nippostrongylus brasiliensis]